MKARLGSVRLRACVLIRSSGTAQPAGRLIACLLRAILVYHWLCRLQNNLTHSLWPLVGSRSDSQSLHGARPEHAALLLRSTLAMSVFAPAGS